MKTELHPIRNEKDHARALAQIERLWGAKPRTREGDRLEVLAMLVDAYEREHHAIEPPDPIAAIEFRMEQAGMDRDGLAKILGSKSRVSEVLNRKRRLSLAMVRSLHAELGIPAEVLIRDVDIATRGRRTAKTASSRRVGTKTRRASRVSASAFR